MVLYFWPTFLSPLLGCFSKLSVVPLSDLKGCFVVLSKVVVASVELAKVTPLTSLRVKTLL